MHASSQQKDPNSNSAQPSSKFSSTASMLTPAPPESAGVNHAQNSSSLPYPEAPGPTPTLSVSSNTTHQASGEDLLRDR